MRRGRDEGDTPADQTQVGEALPPDLALLLLGKNKNSFCLHRVLKTCLHRGLGVGNMLLPVEELVHLLKETAHRLCCLFLVLLNSGHTLC